MGTWSGDREFVLDEIDALKGKVKDVEQEHHVERQLVSAAIHKMELAIIRQQVVFTKGLNDIKLVIATVSGGFAVLYAGIQIVYPMFTGD